MQPLKIVGSRLQTLSLLGIGVAVLIGRSGELLPWAIPLALVFFASAAIIGARLARLSKTGVSIRRVTGTRQASIGDFEAYADHRHLRLKFADGKRARIEVPVEIRPQVRDWAEAANVARSTDTSTVVSTDTDSNASTNPATDAVSDPGQ